MQAAVNNINVLIVDDHAVVRTGLRMLLEGRPGLHVVGEAADQQAALDLCRSASVDVVLLDLDLGEEDGLQILPELFKLNKDTRVLVLTGVRDVTAHHRAIEQGAVGVVQKETAGDVLLKAIERVHAGEVWIDRITMAHVLSGMSRARTEERKPDPEAEKIATLTGREHEVIALICEGLKNRHVADRLFITETTVRHHLTSIFGKLGVGDRLELVIYSYRHGLCQPPS